MNEFVSIDFETANESRDSACEVALIRFQNGIPTNRYSSLIFQDRFAPFNMLLHGITPKLVKKAPSFKVVWEEMKQFIGSSPLIAHNASFDMGVLYKSLKGEPLGTEIDYFCTMIISKRMLDLTY